MKSIHSTRREFLKTSGAMIMTAHAIHSSFASGTTPTWGIALRDAHLGEVQAPDVWTAMKQVGITGVEVGVNDKLQCRALFHPQKSYTIDSDSSIQQLKSDVEAHGMHICAFLMANRFDERLDFELEWCAQVVHAATLLGVKAVRIDVVPRKLKRENFLPFAIDVGKRLVKQATGTPVHFAIENHGNTTNDPDFLMPLFEGVGSDRLGLTLDTGNFYWYGHPLSKVYDLYKQFAPRVFHTHCKSIHYPADKRNVQRPMGWEYGKYNSPIYEGDIDFGKVIRILQDAKYAGDLCIENEALGKYPQKQRKGVLQKEVDYLKQLTL